MQSTFREGEPSISGPEKFPRAGDPAVGQYLKYWFEIIEKKSSSINIDGANFSYIRTRVFPWEEVAEKIGGSRRRFKDFASANFKHGVVEVLSIEYPYRSSYRFKTRAIDENACLALMELWGTACMPCTQGYPHRNSPPTGPFTAEVIKQIVSETRDRLGDHPPGEHIHDINPLNPEAPQKAQRIITVSITSEGSESHKKKAEPLKLSDFKKDFFRKFLPEISDESAKQELEAWNPKKVSEKNISLGKSFHQPDDEIQDPEISELLRIGLMYILVFKAGNKEQLDHAIDVMSGRYQAVKQGFYHAVDIFNQCKDYPVSDRLNNLYDIYTAIKRKMGQTYGLFRNPDPISRFALRATRGRATHTGRII